VSDNEAITHTGDSSDEPVNPSPDELSSDIHKTALLRAGLTLASF